MLTRSWLETAAQAHPDAVYLVEGARSITFAEMSARVRVLSQRLQALGAEHGSRIATLVGNGSRLVELMHACQYLGTALAPLNPLLTQREIDTLLDTAKPGLLLYGPEYADKACKSVVAPCVETDAELDAVEPIEASLPVFDQHRVLTILFTSGTTGRPKGAQLTNANHHVSAVASASRVATGSESRWLACMPLHHVGGLAMFVRAAVDGSRVVLHRSFDPQDVMQTVEHHRITHISLVARMLARILDDTSAPGWAETLERVLVGGGRLPDPLLRRAVAAGIPVVPTYGLTEACSQVCTAEHVRVDAGEGWCGRPVDGTEIDIVDPDGEGRGEIRVRSAAVMEGYFDDAESSARVVRDGWLYTGDIGALDRSGQLYVECRRSDLIVTGGENVYPAEVESVLVSHPRISEAVVYGRRDDEWGEQVCAALVAEGAPPGREEIRSWCGARLARFKVPSRIGFVDRLPVNASGKVDRTNLQRLAEKRFDETERNA